MSLLMAGLAAALAAREMDRVVLMLLSILVAMAGLMLVLNAAAPEPRTRVRRRPVEAPVVHTFSNRIVRQPGERQQEPVEVEEPERPTFRPLFAIFVFLVGMAAMFVSFYADQWGLGKQKGIGPDQLKLTAASGVIQVLGIIMFVMSRRTP